MGVRFLSGTGLPEQNAKNKSTAIASVLQKKLVTCFDTEVNLTIWELSEKQNKCDDGHNVTQAISLCKHYVQHRVTYMDIMVTSQHKESSKDERKWWK